MYSIASETCRTGFDASKAAHRVFADGAMATTTIVSGAFIDINVNTTNSRFFVIKKVAFHSLFSVDTNLLIQCLHKC